MNYIYLIFSVVGILVSVKYSLQSKKKHLKKSIDMKDVYLSAPQLIRKYGYPVEVHHVISKDGYVLEMHRIPYGKRSGPSKNKTMVFLQHGLLASSACWIITGPEKGLGYLLADSGYDVWLGNNRGTTYSRRNIHYQPHESKFWDFSFHEIGIYDLPAMIDYALNVSNQTRTYYIGHSQGTTAFYVMCSEKPEYNAKIRTHFSFGPIGYMSHMTSPLMSIIAHLLAKPFSKLTNLFGSQEFLPNTKLMAEAGKLLCSDKSLTQSLCSNVLFLLYGFSKKEMNNDLIPLIMGHNPAGASTKCFIHYSQMVKSGKFRQWDYGDQNFVHYKRKRPPKYKLRNVTAPIIIFYSQNDILAAEVDVSKLYRKLGNAIGKYKVQDKMFNHLDFIWGSFVDTVLYDKVFKLMNKN